MSLRKHLSIIKKGLKNIDDDQTLDINEVFAMGLIVNTKLEPSRFTMYRLIKKGTLQTVDVGLGQPRYLISGKSLKNFIKSRYKLS